MEEPVIKNNMYYQGQMQCAINERFNLVYINVCRIFQKIKFWSFYGDLKDEWLADRKECFG